MPCNSRITQSVSEGKLNEGVLEAGLVSLGFKVHLFNGAVKFTDNLSIEGDYADGRLTVRTFAGRDGLPVMAKIKQAYAGQAVRVAAKRCGWSVSSSVASPNKLRMSRG